MIMYEYINPGEGGEMPKRRHQIRVLTTTATVDEEGVVEWG